MDRKFPWRCTLLGWRFSFQCTPKRILHVSLHILFTHNVHACLKLLQHPVPIIQTARRLRWDHLYNSIRKAFATALYILCSCDRQREMIGCVKRYCFDFNVGIDTKRHLWISSTQKWLDQTELNLRSKLFCYGHFITKNDFCFLQLFKFLLIPILSTSTLRNNFFYVLINHIPTIFNYDALYETIMKINSNTLVIFFRILTLWEYAQFIIEWIDTTCLQYACLFQKSSTNYGLDHHIPRNVSVWIRIIPNWVSSLLPWNP